MTIIANIASKRDNEELRELRRVFREIDRNRDGAITLDELSESMNSLVLLMQAEVSTIEDLFRLVDLSGNGVIEWSEFVAAGLDVGVLLSD